MVEPTAVAAKAYVGLGSNLGDRHAYIQGALAALKAHPDIHVRTVSTVLETAPIGIVDQPPFLNAVVCLETTLAPVALLAVMLGIEVSLGRVRRHRWGPRTIDLDLLLYNDCAIIQPGLTVPHPEIMRRPFVLEGLRELGVQL